MAPPLFFTGYYPGKRKVKKKIGRPKTPDQPMLYDAVFGTFAINNDFLELPTKVKEQVESEFNNSLRIRYTGPPSDELGNGSGELMYALDESEYEEMYGLSATLDLKTLVEKGPQEAAIKLGKSIVGSVTLRDFSSAMVVQGVWAPNLDQNTGLRIGGGYFADDLRTRGGGVYPVDNNPLSWRAAGYVVDKDQYGNPLPSYGKNLVLKDGKIEGGYGETGIEIFDILNKDIVKFVETGISKRQDTWKDVQQDLLDSILFTMYHSPVMGPQSARFAEVDREIRKIQGLHRAFQDAKKLDKKAGDSFMPTPFRIDKALDDAQRDHERALENFWYKLVLDSEFQGEVSRMCGNDPRLMAWVQILTRQNTNFHIYEILDSVAEGNVFKNLVWKWLMSTQLRYFNPNYYIRNGIKYIIKNAGIGKLNFQKEFQKLIYRLFDKHFRKISQKLASTAIGKALGQIIAGGLKGTIQGALNSAILAMLGVSASTGIGLIIGAIAAAIAWSVEFVGKKMFAAAKAVTKAFITLDPFSITDQAAKEIEGCLKTCLKCCAPILLIFSCFTFFFIIIGSVAPLSGVLLSPWGVLSSMGPLSGIPVPVAVPGGSGIGACVASTRGKNLPTFFDRTRSPEGFDRTTSCFGCRNLGSGPHFHSGVDLVKSAGTLDAPVLNPYSKGGTDAVSVRVAGWDVMFGNYIVLRVYGQGDSDGIADEYYMYFAHLNSISIRPGTPLTPGVELGKAGTTGNSTGPHLHFEIRSGNVSALYAVNPCYVVNVNLVNRLTGATCPSPIACDSSQLNK